MTDVKTHSAASAVAPARRSLLPAWAVEDYLANRILCCTIGVFLALTLADAVISGESFLPFVGVYLGRVAQVVLLVGSVAVVIAALHVMREGHESPMAELARRLVQMLRRANFARHAVGAMVLTVFMSAFLFNKMRIPELNAFAWDETFMEWDRVLFFGNHPWEVLQPLLGWPPATLFIDYVYSTWVPLVFVVWLAMMTPKVSHDLRSQYWLATVLSWIVVGLVMATFLSSAGPCYYDLVVPGRGNPYLGLDAYLAGVADRLPLSSSLAKEFLWTVHAGALDDIGGISAMPSMHNAQAALFAAAAYRYDRRLGHVASVFLALIFVGSIHLGWHYAVDGIVGIAASLVLWWLAGAIVRREAKTGPLRDPDRTS